MQNDRAFAIYSLSLIALTAFVASWAMSATGLTLTAQKTLVLIEHLAIGITFRAAYKSFDGSNWILDLLHATGMVTPIDAITAEHEALPAGAEVAAA